MSKSESDPICTSHMPIMTPYAKPMPCTVQRERQKEDMRNGMR